MRKHDVIDYCIVAQVLIFGRQSSHSHSAYNLYCGFKLHVIFSSIRHLTSPKNIVYEDYSLSISPEDDLSSTAPAAASGGDTQTHSHNANLLFPLGRNAYEVLLPR